MEQIIGTEQAEDIIDVTVQNFMEEVIEASKQKAVIVQFWAPWCGPCKQLGPVLEKVAGEKDNIRLARVNIDDNPEIASQMRVQSVPTVFGIIEGRPVDAFAGAQAESAVRQFVDKLADMAPGAPDISAFLDAGRQALMDNQPEQAMMQFQSAMAQIPDSLEALAGLVRTLVLMGEVEQAREILDQLDPEKCEQAEMREAVSAVEIAEKGAGSASEIDALRAKLASAPDDHQCHIDLAVALFAISEQAEAMEILLDSIRADAGWQDGAARTQLLEFFTALGPAHPDVITARRKLSTYLFS
jgi:putative thioredoxin